MKTSKFCLIYGLACLGLAYVIELRERIDALEANTRSLRYQVEDAQRFLRDVGELHADELEELYKKRYREAVA